MSIKEILEELPKLTPEERQGNPRLAGGRRISRDRRTYSSRRQRDSVIRNRAEPVHRGGKGIDSAMRYTVKISRQASRAPHQILGPAISEAAQPRCSTPIAIKLPDTPRRSEAPPR
jgi:hypothetical protein